ncbi:hypothetical protein RND71_008370 [Anisodus tanguticus]|uniref:Uncharacterized protein n=1 Tax=Anisodus tanguticus TaxID=243964 RepID=A0AAE1VQN8_9SOLA|nr:hypothetical protein RND71_008370 [Anisodus tanguticus]
MDLRLMGIDAPLFHTLQHIMDTAGDDSDKPCCFVVRLLPAVQSKIEPTTTQYIACKRGCPTAKNKAVMAIKGGH